MQDYTFLDDYDYTFCGNCHSSIQPYDNTSITTITKSIIKSTSTSTSSSTEKEIEEERNVTTIKITKQILSSTNSFTALLIKYHHLHCQKCGLYIEIHPKYDDETSQKIFICSQNSDNNNPHKYCLCYHCGLLYGINPNQKSIDIINILQHRIDNMQKESELENKNKPKENQSKVDGEPNTGKPEREEIGVLTIKTEEDEEENSLDLEVNDDSDHIHVDDDEDEMDKLSKENEISRKNSIDESYLNILALKERLSNIHISNHNNNGNGTSTPNNKTVSCPTSPNVSSSASHKFAFNHLPKSLRGSPLLGPSTPSPRILGQDLDEMDKKWQQYLIKQKEQKEKDHEQTLNNKMSEQESQIEKLKQLLNKAKNNKNNAKDIASIFRRGAYSNKINLINNTSISTKLES